MNRHDVELLQSITGYPALSITMPTHRNFPENKQDVIRLKNLASGAVERLLGEFGKREISGLLNNLDKAVESVDHNMNLDGLAIYVNSDISRVFQLPFSPRERTVVDDTFLTRDLVFALNRSSRYWLLALSEKPTRLYEGFRENLVEVRDEGFPMEHKGPGGATALPGGKGARKSAYRDEYHGQFFRKINRAMAGFITDDPLPLFVTGVDRFLSMYRDISSFPVEGEIKGSHDRTSPHELGKMAWPLVEDYLERHRKALLGNLAKAMSEGSVISTIGEAWQASLFGRGRTLFVEEGFHYPATVDESGLEIKPSDDPEAPGVIDDAVDEVIEAVLAAGGEVVFLPDGTLADHDRLALITRY